MTFLCLCYYDQTMFDALKPDDLAALEEACKPHDEALRNSARLFAQASLAFPQTARTVRPGKNDPSVMGGPYTASKEPIGTFFIVEAQDMDEAAQVASKHPGAHVGNFLGGGIEVRACDIFQAG
jgi:hypothetical protein